MDQLHRFSFARGSSMDAATATLVSDDSEVDEPRRAAPLRYRDPGRYIILGEQGSGGLGHVLRAHDRELRRDVAIKVPRQRGDTSEVRFLREAMVAAHLQHPSIVPIHEAGRWPDGTPFYVMKLVQGRTLKELIAERTTIDERLALIHHVAAVADAMAYAHERRIVHRDLKPANVIAGAFGDTIVIDWGLAKDLAVAEPADCPPDEPDERAAVEPRRCALDARDDLTAAGTILGTPMYMPPEQAGGKPVDERADVYAIGAMLWELCSLERRTLPGSGETARALRSARIHTDLIAIIAKATAADPADRYRNAGELAADLATFLVSARFVARRFSLFGILAGWFLRRAARSAARRRPTGPGRP